MNSFNPEKPYYSDYRKSGFIRAKQILTSVGKNRIEKILDNNFYNVKTSSVSRLWSVLNLILTVTTSKDEPPARLYVIILIIKS